MNLLVALGIGLLLGVERERHKGRGPGRGAAGVRTFALAALLGGLAARLGVALIAVCAAFAGAAALVAYLRGADGDPGLTTEVALVLTVLLGALAIEEPTVAAGLAVVVTGLLS